MRGLPIKFNFIILAAFVIITGAYFYVAYVSAGNNSTTVIPSITTLPGESGPKADESYFLTIDKIKISVPIILNVDGNDKDAYMKSLEGGVAHLRGTAYPGAYGNAVIFGHSSYYADKPGNYKKIFASLDRLEKNDEIFIKSENITFQYIVTEKSIVKPDEISVVDQNMQKKELTLLTCWPIGSTEKRLVIKSELDGTTPSQN